MAHYIQANTNGRLHPAHEASLSPLSRGFLYGDAIYEVWRSYEGILFAWDEHYDRLERSARALYLTLPWTRAEMWSQVARTVAAFRAEAPEAGDVYVRLQVGRGAGPIGLDPDLADRAEYVLLVQPLPAPPPSVLSRGATLSIAAGLRRNPIECLNPAWKTGNYLNNILGLREARSRGADDVVLLNVRGEVTEASTSNLGFVRDGEVYTPRLDAGILEGITRGLLLRQVAPAAGVHVHEAVLRPPELAGMTECFMLSTTRDLTPVGAIDGMSFTVGPTTLTARLKAAFQHQVRAYNAAHPERKL